MVREIDRIKVDLPGYLWHLAQQIKCDAVRLFEVHPETMQ